MAFEYEFIDSFKAATSLSLLRDKWKESATAPDPTTGSGFSFLNGLVIDSGSSIYWKRSSSTIPPSMVNTIVRRDSDTQRVLFSFYNSTAGATRFTLRWNADGKIEVFNGAGVSLGTTTSSYLAGVDHILDIHYRRISSTSGVVRIYKNTVLDGTFTQSGTETEANRLYLGGEGSGASSGANFTFRHITVASDPGGSGISPLGECSVILRRPTGLGSIATWTGTADDINESVLNLANYLEITPDGTGIGLELLAFGGIVSPYNVLGACLDIVSGLASGTGTAQLFFTKRLSGVTSNIGTYHNQTTTALFQEPKAKQQTYGAYGVGVSPASYGDTELGFNATTSGKTYRVYQAILEVVLHGPPPVDTQGWRVGAVGFG